MYSFIGSYSNNNWSSINEVDIWREIQTGQLYFRQIGIKHHKLLGDFRKEPRSWVGITSKNVPDLKLFIGNLDKDYSKSSLTFLDF